MSPRTALLLLALTGCATVPTTGAFHNPRFTQAQAPGPAVALEVVPCSLSGVPLRPRSAPDGAYGELFRSLGIRPIAVDDSLAERVCAVLARDRALYEDLVYGSDWSVGQGLAPELGQLARAQGAQAVLVPLTRSHSGCPPGESFFRKDEELGPGRIQAPVCGDDTRVDVGLFLFSADGTLLWKSSGTAGTPAARDLLPVLERVTAGVPAHLEPRPPPQGGTRSPQG